MLEKAIKLCKSKVALERELGVVVLMRTPGKTFRDEAVRAIADLAAIETDDSVIGDLAYAMHHLDVPDSLAFLLRAASSPDPVTRTGAAYSLSALSDGEAIKCKIALSNDPADIEPLIAALASDEVWISAIDAAREMANPLLYPSLIALKKRCPDLSESVELDKAIETCAPHQARNLPHYVPN